jgi:hypothetical protein
MQENNYVYLYIFINKFIHLLIKKISVEGMHKNNCHI